MPLTGRGRILRSAWLMGPTIAARNFARADLYHQEAFGIANRTDAIVWDDWFFPEAAAGAVTVTPSTASLTLTTFAPTVTTTAHQVVTPGTASLTLTTFAPTVTVSNPVVVTPGTASLTLTTFAPVVTASNNQVVVPGTASLVLTTFAPTVSVTNHQVVTPGPAALTLTTFAPTVTVSNHITVTPGPAALTIQTFAPTVTVSGNQVVTPGTASLTLATFAPTITISDHKVVTPFPASLVLTTFAPSVVAGGNVTVTPSPASLVLTTFAPTVEVSIDEFPVILLGGDDAPRRKRIRNRKERRDVFKDMEQTIHRLLHPVKVVVEETTVAPVLDTGAARRAVDELLVLAQGQHALLQRAAVIESTIADLESAQREQEEEEFLIWML